MQISTFVEMESGINRESAVLLETQVSKTFILFILFFFKFWHLVLLLVSLCRVISSLIGIDWGSFDYLTAKTFGFSVWSYGSNASVNTIR